MAVNAVGAFFIALIVFLVVAGVSWVIFTQLRARRLGLPSPPLSSYIPFAHSSQSPFGSHQSGAGGVRGWISDRFRKLKNPRSAAGAYEPSATAGRRGFGPLDPDEAWDASVGHEAYGVGGAYNLDDQELEDRSHQHHDLNTSYPGSGYQMNLAGDGADEGRGRDPHPRAGNLNANTAYAGAQRNPFDDAAAEPSNISMRGFSPRANIDTQRATPPPVVGGNQTHDSPTSGAERRSVFREDV